MEEYQPIIAVVLIFTAVVDYSANLLGFFSRRNRGFSKNRSINIWLKTVAP